MACGAAFVVSACLLIEIALGSLPDIGVHDFSCPASVMVPSRTKPTSVHSVRPADIQIVAALGDSLTAANGARSVEPLTLLLQYRGAAFQIGGDDSLEKHVTIPNVLRKFNPHLFGYSKGIGTADDWEVAYFNDAVPGAVSSDLPGQARKLLGKMQAHPELVDIEKDWKLVNIFIGGNDMCQYCEHQTKESPENFAKGIREAIQILYDNLKRVIVSLTGMFHLEMLRNVDSHRLFCGELHIFECPCESHVDYTDADMDAVERKYQEAQMRLQTSGIFEREDFTLIIQPFLREVRVPPLKDGKTDKTFFAPDCFHFSQFGHARVSTHLWKNLMQPVNKKMIKANLSTNALPLACPDEACPFIRTTKNSEDCALYLTPGADAPIV